MPNNLSAAYSNALATYGDANRNSALDRTRARGVLEQLSPLVQQESRNVGALEEAKIRGRFGLDEQGLKNTGRLAEQTLANTGRLEDRTLANVGMLNKQKLFNTGRMDERHASDASALERLGISTASDTYQTNLRTASDLKTKQMGIDATVSEGKLNRLATLEKPNYMKVQTGTDELGNPIYSMQNINTPASRARSKNVGALSPEQRSGFTLTDIKIPKKPKSNVRSPRSELKVRSYFAR